MELNHAEVKVKSTIPQNKILHIHIYHLRNENTICYLDIIKDVLEHKVEEREEFFEVVLQRSSRQEQPRALTTLLSFGRFSLARS